MYTGIYEQWVIFVNLKNYLTKYWNKTVVIMETIDMKH